MGGYQAGLSSFTIMIQVVVIIAGSVFIKKGLVSITDLVTFILYINVFTDPIKTLIDFTEQFQNGYSGFERFMEILNIEPDIADRPGAKTISNVRGEIEFDDVSFRYEQDTQTVLNHINLKVSAGEYAALVGSSGAGKTTLCSLIPRFYDVTEGSVKLDGTDVRDIKLKSLRGNIGIVQQDVYLLQELYLRISDMESLMQRGKKLLRRQRMPMHMNLSCHFRTGTIPISGREALSCPEARNRDFQ